MKRILRGIILLALVSGCATVSRNRVYQIGDIEIRIFSNQKDLIRDMPTDVHIALKVYHVGMFGWHKREGNKSTIWTLDNLDSFLHELKHYLEPGWVHSVPCGQDLCLKEIK